MKKSIVFAVMAVVLAACATKENPYTSELIPEKNSEGKVVLYATMPGFEATKAGISDGGVFSWTVGDKIDVVFSKSASPDEVHTFTCTNASTGAFEYDGDVTEGYAVSGAFYPTGYDGTPSEQHFASLADAAKGFQMEATVDEGKLKFAHENAMFAIQIQNVPACAKTVWINGASVDISGSTGDVDVRLPGIPKASAKLGFGVNDVAYNESDTGHKLIAKTSEKAAVIAAAKFYNLNDLEITQAVHFLSDDSGWTANGGNIIDPATGATGFRVLEDEWFRFAVEYVGGDLVVDYGYTAGVDYNNSVPFEAYCTQGAKVTTPGVYKVTFDSLTGTYTVTKTNEAIYLIGINGSWTFDSSTNALTPVIGKMLAWKGTPTNGSFKAYLYGETDWTDNTYGASAAGNSEGPIYTGSSAKNCGVDASDEAMIVFDYGLSTWYHSSGLVSEAASKVYIEGEFSFKNGASTVVGDWTEEKGIALTQHAAYPRIWYVEDLEVTAEGEMKFVEGGSTWYGAGGDPQINVASNANYRLWTSSSNLVIPAGTYTIYYNDMAHSYSLVKTN